MSPPSTPATSALERAPRSSAMPIKVSGQPFDKAGQASPVARRVVRDADFLRRLRESGL